MSFSLLMARLMVKPFWTDRSWLRSGHAESTHEIESHWQHERTIAVKVIEEPIRDRRLRRNRFQRGMRIDAACRTVETRIGYPPQADTRVVVIDVLDQPLDRVIRV